MKLLVKVLLAATLLAVSAAHAQNASAGYPSRPVKLIVPLYAGGAADIIGRTVADGLSRLWGVPVIVDNKPGAGSNVGVEALARSVPDGYTIGQINVASHSINPALQKGKLPFDPIKDFEPISMMAISTNLLVVNPQKLPVSSIAELVAFLKKNPGKFSYSSAGIGTTLHLGMELFKDVTGTDVLHVPYSTGAARTADLLTGRVDMTMDVAANIWQHIESGKLRALAVVSAQRASFAPELPTVAETFPSVQIMAWHAIGAPAGTPKAIIDKISADVQRVIASPEVQAKLKQNYLVPSSMNPGELKAFIVADMARWARAVEKSGATAN